MCFPYLEALIASAVHLDKVLSTLGLLFFGTGILAGELVLTVSNIHEPGTLCVTLYQDAQTFDEDMVNTRTPVEKIGVHSVTRESTTDRVARLVISVPDGMVAIAVFHDTNGNDAIDEGLLGIPREQYGFGNNARPLFRAPSYRASSIMIEGRTAHSIKLR